MNKKVYIDGNLLVKNGVFWGLKFCMFADENLKKMVDEIIPCNDEGIYEVTEDGGSMFTEYYVKGGITMYGENGSSITCFKEEHEHTYIKFKRIQDQILLLLKNAIVPNECQNSFYQQQYNDNQKRRFCALHEFKLIEIPYTEENLISYDYIMKNAGY